MTVCVRKREREKEGGGWGRCKRSHRRCHVRSLKQPTPQRRKKSKPAKLDIYTNRHDLLNVNIRYPPQQSHLGWYTQQVHAHPHDTDQLCNTNNARRNIRQSHVHTTRLTLQQNIILPNRPPLPPPPSTPPSPSITADQSMQPTGQTTVNKKSADSLIQSL